MVPGILFQNLSVILLQNYIIPLMIFFCISGSLQHEEPHYEHAIVDNAEDSLDVENDDDDFDEEGYESFEDEKSNDHGSFDDLEFHVYDERSTLKALSGNRTPSQIK